MKISRSYFLQGDCNVQWNCEEKLPTIEMRWQDINEPKFATYRLR